MAECTGDICRSNRTKRIVWDRLASVARGFPTKKWDEPLEPHSVRRFATVNPDYR